MTCPRIKITHVGEEQCGKTKLIMTAFQHNFTQEYTPTVFDNSTMSVKVCDDDHVCIVLADMWDTVDNEYGRRLRPLTYPQTNVFILCFSIDNQNAFDTIKSRWLPELYHHMKASHVLLVGTKIDLRDDPEAVMKLEEKGKKLISVEEAEKFANDQGLYYVECSSKTGEGLNRVYKTATALGLLNAVGESRVVNSRPLGDLNECVNNNDNSDDDDNNNENAKSKKTTKSTSSQVLKGIGAMFGKKKKTLGKIDYEKHPSISEQMEHLTNPSQRIKLNGNVML